MTGSSTDSTTAIRSHGTALTMFPLRAFDTPDAARREPSLGHSADGYPHASSLAVLNPHHLARIELDVGALQASGLEHHRTSRGAHPRSLDRSRRCRRDCQNRTCDSKSASTRQEGSSHAHDESDQAPFEVTHGHRSHPCPGETTRFAYPLTHPSQRRIASSGSISAQHP